MATIARILATLTTILGVPLIWHSIMPASAHWMTPGQILCTLPLFIISLVGYSVCWLSLNNEI